MHETATTVDIPTDWDPRANQSPSGALVAVLRTAAGARRVPFGVEVALGYLIAKEAEWTAVRIVMAGRLAGLSADAIRERLRDTYV